MRRSRLIVSGLLLLLLVLTLLLVRSYRLDLVETVLVEALVEKAPAGYPARHIQEVFLEARRRCHTGQARQEYLERLFEVARRLEKVQSLSGAQVEDLLHRIDPQRPAGEAPSRGTKGARAPC